MNIFAFTEFVPTPGYVSINSAMDDAYTISVRTTGRDGDVGQYAELTISRETFLEMAEAIRKEARPKVSPAPSVEPL